MAGESLIFVFGIPAFLFWRAAAGGERWRFKLPPALLLLLVLAALVCAGLVDGLDAIPHARGTPVPLMATKKLLTDKPYSFCRNLDGTGTLVFYFNVAVCTACSCSC